MAGWQAALWGLFGGFALEGLDMRAAVRRYGTWPWCVADSQGGGGPASHLIAELIRMFIGAGLAWATAASGQTSGPFAAVAVGVTAPLIIERFTQVIPLTDGDAAHIPVRTTGIESSLAHSRERVIGGASAVAAQE